MTKETKSVAFRMDLKTVSRLDQLTQIENLKLLEIEKSVGVEVKKLSRQDIVTRLINQAWEGGRYE